MKITNRRVYLSPAKLNLFLHLTGKRADGYHFLQTVFVMIALFDRLRISLRGDGIISRATNCPEIYFEDDLCIKAARMLKDEIGTGWGADIEIEKNIPIGAGMGGGSSNAAIILLALNELWRGGLSRKELMTIAPKVGADVPFFIFGETAFGEGVGERLFALNLDLKWFLIINPGVAVSTKKIFKECELTPNRKPITIQRFLDGASTQNDLESVVCALYPEVDRCLTWLKDFGDARVTGSGGTVFCEFKSEEEANRVCAKLPKSMAGSVVKALQKHPFF